MEKINGGVKPFNALAGNVKFYKVDLTTNTSTGATAETVDFTDTTTYDHKRDLEIVYQALSKAGTVVAMSVESATVVHAMVENAGFVDNGDSTYGDNGGGYTLIENEIEANLEANLYDDEGAAVTHTRNVEVAITGTTSFKAV